jgi:hypothetical protein
VRLWRMSQRPLRNLCGADVPYLGARTGARRAIRGPRAARSRGAVSWPAPVLLLHELPPTVQRGPARRVRSIQRGYHVLARCHPGSSPTSRGPRIGYVSRRVRAAQEDGARPLNPRAMIDATIFALLVGAVATPISWWGISRLGLNRPAPALNAKICNRMNLLQNGRFQLMSPSASHRVGASRMGCRGRRLVVSRPLAGGASRMPRASPAESHPSPRQWASRLTR